MSAGNFISGINLGKYKLVLLSITQQAHSVSVQILRVCKKEISCTLYDGKVRFAI